MYKAAMYTPKKCEPWIAARLHIRIDTVVRASHKIGSKIIGPLRVHSHRLGKPASQNNLEQ